MTDSESLVFKIGGIKLGLSIKAGWEFSPLGRFPDFYSHDLPTVNYPILLNPSPGAPAGSLIFDSGQSWRLFHDQHRMILWVGSRTFIPRLVGHFSSDYRSGEIYITKSKREPAKYVFPLSYPLGELLMTSLLGTGYGIMLHSCGVIDDGNGMVFAGVGSSGKTTTARLWNNNPGVRVINDDHTILRKINDQFRVYGTPWHGQEGIALAEDAPLKKLFILKHAQSNQAERLSPAQAVAAILVRTFAPLWSASAMDFTLQFLDELCHSVPCYELGFIPDQSAVEYVRCLSLD
jgi:hypothetical protein